jgi:hypothetical protein
MDGGRDPYLSPLDVPKFRDTILERAVELNCITQHEMGSMKELFGGRTT